MDAFVLNGNHRGFLQTEDDMVAAFDMVVQVFEIDAQSILIQNQVIGLGPYTSENLTMSMLFSIIHQANMANGVAIGKSK